MFRALRPADESTHLERSSLPPALSGTQAPGWIAELGLGFWELGSLRNFVYLLADPESRLALVVDPQKDLTPLLEALEAEKLTLQGILLTHSHFDHIAGVPALLTRFPAAQVFVGELDAWRLKGLSPERITPILGGSLGTLRSLDDAPTLDVGNTRIRLFSAPGHSAGALISLFERGGRAYAFTGDTIFVRDCGRTDLETGSTAALFETLQGVRRLLPRKTVLLPGHHYAGQIATVLGADLEESAPFLCRSTEDLESLP